MISETNVVGEENVHDKRDRKDDWKMSGGCADRACGRVEGSTSQGKTKFLKSKIASLNLWGRIAGIT
jgi:hypothetical protein